MKQVSAILATALLFCGALGAQAAVYVKADAEGANNGTSWADAYTSPFDAIAAAAGEGADRTIFIAQGVYSISDEYTLPDTVEELKAEVIRLREENAKLKKQLTDLQEKDK